MRFIFQLSVFCFLHFTQLSGQPSFPSTPSQAPVTGLELLVLTGGAMVVRKLLKNKNSQ